MEDREPENWRTGPDSAASRVPPLCITESTPMMMMLVVVVVMVVVMMMVRLVMMVVMIIVVMMHSQQGPFTPHPPQNSVLEDDEHLVAFLF